MPRARRSGGNISRRGGAREHHDRLRGAAEREARGTTSSPELDAAAERGDRSSPTIPSTNPRDHGHPADAVHHPPGGPDRERAGDEEDAGPEPEDPLEPGDAHERHGRRARRASWTIPERQTSPAASRIVLRRHARSVESSHASEMLAGRRGTRPRAAVRGVADVRRRRAPRARRGRPAITRRPRASSSQERAAGVDLGARRRGGSSGSSPGCVGTTFQQQTSLLEAELGEHAVDDRRRRLGRAVRR